MKNIFFLLAFPLVLTSCKPKANKLHLKLTKDQTYYIANTQSAELQQPYQGKIKQIGTEIGITYAIKVTNITQDSLYQMEVTYEHLHLRDRTQGGLLATKDTFNHAPFNFFFAFIIKHPFKIVITPSGKISFISNMDNLIEEGLTSCPNLSVTDRKRMKTFLQEFFSDAAFRKVTADWVMHSQIYS